MPGNGRIRRFFERLFQPAAPEGIGPLAPAELGPQASGEPGPGSPERTAAPSDLPPAAEVRVEALVAPPHEANGALEETSPPSPASAPNHAQVLWAPDAETADRLARLPKALSDLAEAVQSQNQTNDRLRDVLATLARPDQEFLHAVHDLAAEGQKQTDLLQNLCGLLSERRQLDNIAAGAMVRLPGLLDDLHKSNASLVEMMEQTRDRWASTNDDLAKEMVRQRRKTTALMIGIFALLAVQTFLLIVRLFTGK